MGYRVFSERNEIPPKKKVTIVLPEDGCNEMVVTKFFIAEYFGSRRISEAEHFSTGVHNSNIMLYARRRNVWVQESAVQAYDTLVEMFRKSNRAGSLVE